MYRILDGIKFNHAFVLRFMQVGSLLYQPGNELSVTHCATTCDKPICSPMVFSKGLLPEEHASTWLLMRGMSDDY